MAEKSRKADKVPVKKNKTQPEQWHFPGSFEDMERAFEDFFSRSWLQRYRQSWPPFGELRMPFEGRLPKVDIIDRDDEIVVRAELPGVNKKDIELSMTENTVTIKGETKSELKKEKGDYYHSETSSGSYSRTLSLPAEVIADETNATFNDGILELTMPKAKKTTRRSIKID